MHNIGAKLTLNKDLLAYLLVNVKSNGLNLMNSPGCKDVNLCTVCSR